MYFVSAVMLYQIFFIALSLRTPVFRIIHILALPRRDVIGLKIHSESLICQNQTVVLY